MGFFKAALPFLKYFTNPVHLNAEEDDLDAGAHSLTDEGHIFRRHSFKA
jgi:hypothetical protein